MAETAEQIEARLVTARAAIDRAVLAQSYSIGGRSHANQALKELRAHERALVLRLHRLTKGAFVLSDFSGDAEDEA